METSQLICTANQWTGFYMREILDVHGLVLKIELQVMFAQGPRYSTQKNLWKLTQKSNSERWKPQGTGKSKNKKKELGLSLREKVLCKTRNTFTSKKAELKIFSYHLPRTQNIMDTAVRKSF